MKHNGVRIFVLLAVVLGLLISVVETDAQNRRRKKKRAAKKPSVVTTAPPVVSEPQVISRAEDFPSETLPVVSDDPASVAERTLKTIEELQNRLRTLEAGPRKDYDTKQKRLALNLDILIKAEQRADALRRQQFEMIEKENTVRMRLDLIENDIRPESIDRQVAFAGSLRPEELRAMRRKSLELERTNLQTLLIEIQKTRANLDANVVKADFLVERLRSKLEKEIDDALADEPEEKPEN